MPDFFDHLVTSATADASVDTVVAGQGPVDREAVRVGAVMASAAVVAGLARRAEDGASTSARVPFGEPFGAGTGRVVAAIARDAPVAPELAERLLEVTIRQATRQLGGPMAEADRSVLRAERDALSAAGWDQWLAGAGVATGRPEGPDLVTVEPEPEPESGPEPGPRPTPGAFPGPTTGIGSPAQAPARRPGSGRRRWIGTGLVALLAVVGAVAAMAMVNGGSSNGRVDNDPAAPASAPGPGDTDTSTGTGTDQPSAPSATTPAATVPSPAAPSSTDDPAAPVGPATYQLALADPTGSSDAAGTVRLDLDPGTGQVCYQFQVTGMEEPFPGHIHAAPVGGSGGITIDFGYLTDAPTGCVQSFPADVAEIVRHPERHYVELHDIEYGFGLRSRLAEAAPAAAGTDPAATAADTAATTVLVGGTVVLRGQVPDETTRAALVAGTADLATQGIEVVDELTIQAGAPAPSGRVVVSDPILFPFDSTELEGDTARSVDQLARILRLRPAWRVTLVGNTDGVGELVYNLVLSLQRAIAVRQALVAAGVSPNSVTIRGDGSFAPVADNATADGRSRNRRIDLVVTGP